MKAIAVHPGVPGSAHLADVPEPRLADVPDGHGVLVEVLRVGVDGTDREINGASELQIMYGVGGERLLPEVELDWLEGYRGSRPVRIGNGA